MQEYNEADWWLHCLCQVIAKANRSFVPKGEDDSHTNFYYDALGHRISGRWLRHGEEELLLELDLPGLVLEYYDARFQKVAEVSAIGRHFESFEQEVRAQFDSLGWPTKGISDPLHFQVPDYGIDQLRVPALDAEVLLQWGHYRQIANTACLGLLGYFQKEAEIRIWPHHFDTGIYFRVSDHLSLGFGLAMEDPIAGAPYFYLSAYGRDGSVLQVDNMKPLSAGQWVSGAWSGAILPIKNVSREIVEGFTLEASRSYLHPNGAGRN